MTPLALRLSRRANAVSLRHGEVAREMWRPLFGAGSADDVPITHVTNGVHLSTFLSTPMRALLDRHLGDGWLDRASDPTTWAPVDEIPDEELWAARNEARLQLVDYVQVKSVQDRLLRGEDPERVKALAETFAADTLTLGFARRIATYKRLFLLTYDPERVRRIFADGPPLQMVVAGKAHPLDNNAKQMLVDVFGLSRRGRDHVTRRVPRELRPLRRGADRRRVRRVDQRAAPAARGERDERDEVGGERRPQPQRARRLVGRGLRRRERLGDRRRAAEGEDEATQDARHAHALYDLLEQQVIPLFHDRDADGIPRGWLAMVKRSLRTNGPRFSAARMVEEYAERIYPPSDRR